MWKHLKDSEKQRLDIEAQIIELLANSTRERPQNRTELTGAAIIQTHVRQRLSHLILTNEHSAVQLFTLFIGGRSDIKIELAATTTNSFALPGILVDRGISLQITGSVNTLFDAYLYGFVEADVFLPPYRQSFP
jgi:hypothetical protein